MLGLWKLTKPGWPERKSCAFQACWLCGQHGLYFFFCGLTKWEKHKRWNCMWYFLPPHSAFGDIIEMLGFGSGPMSRLPQWKYTLFHFEKCEWCWNKVNFSSPASGNPYGDTCCLQGGWFVTNSFSTIPRGQSEWQGQGFGIKEREYLICLEMRS